jgi:hypothetical protein
MDGGVLQYENGRHYIKSTNEENGQPVLTFVGETGTEMKNNVKAFMAGKEFTPSAKDLLNVHTSDNPFIF